MTTQVPADRAEQGLIEFLLGVLGNWPVWMQTLYRLTCDAIRDAAGRVPEDRIRDSRKAEELERQIENLVNTLARSGLASPAITNRLREAEVEKAAIDSRLASSAKFDVAKIELPDETWVATRLGEWAIRRASNDGPESLLRLALETVVAESVIAVGKKRGFCRLRFRPNTWGILAAAVCDSLSGGARELLPRATPESSGGPEFTLDLGQPTPMDRWAPQIVEWRAADVTWEEIVRRTGMDLNRVYIAWKRYVCVTNEPPAA